MEPHENVAEELCPGPLPAAETEPSYAGDLVVDLVAELVEHVMRLSSDDVAVLSFLASTPCSTAAMAALGRLGPHAGVCIGSPLYAWCTGTELAPAWRAAVPAAPSTMWAELEDLRAMLGSKPARNAYDELCLLRDASTEWMG